MMRSLIVSVLAFSLASFAQNHDAPQNTPAYTQPPEQPVAINGQISPDHVIVPAGTEVLLQLKSAIDSRNNRVGDGVYCQTAFPVTVGNTIAIPAGTYVKGEIVKLHRAGRVKGRGEVLFRFNTLIFPNGYTVDLPGTVHNDSGTRDASVDNEGNIKADRSLGKDAEKIEKGGEYGAAIGGIGAGSLNGVRAGGGIGLAAGIATVLLTRGNEVRIEPGASIKMLTQRPLTIDVVPVDPNRAATEVIPRPSQNTRLPAPANSPNGK
jgi:type IV secretion system protein VirB10